MIKTNEANWDRIVRVLLGIALLYFGLSGSITGTIGVTLTLVFGAILTLTGLIGFCPMYKIFKFSTKSN